jgi:hypothetical protein
MDRRVSRRLAAHRPIKRWLILELLWTEPGCRFSYDEIMEFAGKSTISCLRAQICLLNQHIDGIEIVNCAGGYMARRKTNAQERTNIL